MTDSELPTSVIDTSSGAAVVVPAGDHPAPVTDRGDTDGLP